MTGNVRHCCRRPEPAGESPSASGGENQIPPSHIRLSYLEEDATFSGDFELVGMRANETEPEPVEDAPGRVEEEGSTLATPNRGSSS
jgi:hypothetical protein